MIIVPEFVGDYGVLLEFFANGAAQPQGSIRALPKRGRRLKDCGFKDMVFTSDNADLKRWRAVVKSEARTAVIQRCSQLNDEGELARCVRPTINPLRDVLWPEGPVSLTLVWFLPRPQRRPERARPAEWERALHCTRPDIDKLERAVLDALTDVLYQDDGQVQSVLTRKFYARPAQHTGVRVTAWQ